MKIVIKQLFGSCMWYAAEASKDFVQKLISLGPQSVILFESRRELISKVREKFRHVKHLQIISPKE